MFFKLFISLSILMLPALLCSGQTQWTLVKDDNGIKVYLGNTDSSKFKAVKVEALIPGTLKKFDSIIRDVNNHKKWIYSTKNSVMVKSVNANEIIYYSETSLPWPLANRDVVSDMTISTDTVSQAEHVLSKNVNGLVEVKDGLVRIPFLRTEWKVQGQNSRMLLFEYYFSVDPGGKLPSWLVNSFAAKGPYNTFLNLKKLLGSD
jgi:hypothetical protein